MGDDEPEQKRLYVPFEGASALSAGDPDKGNPKYVENPLWTLLAEGWSIVDQSRQDGRGGYWVTLRRGPTQ